MKRICPNPIPWHAAFERLSKYAQDHVCSPPSPPKPLILAGWVSSNDVEKMERWAQTLAWAAQNGCKDLVSAIPDSDFYFVEELARYEVGPIGGPMYLPSDYEPKIRPSSQKIAQLMDSLCSQWSEVVGNELARITWPLAFTGKKARRFIVCATAAATPPWGSWSHLSRIEAKRRTFTSFRASINAVIAPHKVDHIDFITVDNLEQAENLLGNLEKTSFCKKE